MKSRKDEEMLKLLHTILANGGNIQEGVKSSLLLQEVEMLERRLILNNFNIWQNQTDRRYYAHIYIGENKKRKLVSRKDLEDLEDYLIVFYKENLESFISELNINRVFEEWIEYKCEYDGLSERTRHRYRQDYQRFFPTDCEICKLHFPSITEEQLELFVRRTIKELELTAKGWAKLRLLLRGIFQYGKKKKYTTLSFQNFSEQLMLSPKVFKKKAVKDKEQVFTRQEQAMLEERFMAEPSLTGLGDILLFYSGLRIGELSALTDKDIRGNEIIVNKQEVSYYDTVERKIVHKVEHYTKTDAGIRNVIVPPIALQVIELIKGIREPNEEGYLFYNENGRLHSGLFSQKLTRACKSLGITKRSAHKIRKTYATRLIDAGVPKNIIIKQMGHTDFGTTEHYYYFNDKQQAEASSIINNAFILKTVS